MPSYLGSVTVDVCQLTYPYSAWLLGDGCRFRSAHSLPALADTNHLPRGWWEEDRSLTQRFYTEALGGSGAAPAYAEPWVVERIVQQHLSCASMLAIFPIQDLFAIDEKLRVSDPNSERINIPAVKHHYWRYRMHVPLEDLQTKHAEWSDRIRRLVQASGRLV